MRLIYLLILTLISIQMCYSQVLNGSFELGGTTGNTAIANAEGWFSPTFGSPDYCENGSGGWCGYCSEPLTNTSFGNRSAAIILEYINYDYKEYITTQFNTPLVSGQTYLISFSVLFCSNPTTLNGMSIPDSLRKIGVYLSTQPPNLTMTTDGHFGSLVDSLTPGKILIPTNHQIYDSTTYNSWVTVNLQYTANGTEDFITIGQFRSGVAGSLPGNLPLMQLKLDNIELKETSTLLPVELASFDVAISDDSQSMELSWETISELNNDFFRIERSADLVTWAEIGIVGGAGTSTDRQYYSFTDYTPHPIEVNYYQLIQTDFNGSKKIYGPKAAKLLPKTEMNVVMDPTHRTVLVEIKNTSNQKVYWFDYRGVQIDCLEVWRSSEAILFDIQSFSAGVYTIVCSDDQEITTERLVIL